MLGFKEKSAPSPQPTIRRAAGRGYTGAIGIFALTLSLAAGIATAAQTPPDLKSLSLKQMVNQGEGNLDDMKRVLKEGFQELKAARQSQSIQKLNQVNEALSTIKGLVKLSEGYFILLQEAAAKGTRDEAERELVKIMIARDKVMDLRGRIRAAGGPEQEGSFDGEAHVDVIKDANVPIIDPIEDVSALDVLNIDAAKPPQASPFL